MKTYNLSPTRATYHSQRNNAVDPGKTCKPEATAECLAIAGWGKAPGKFAQSGDNITALCRSEEGHAAMRRLSPTNPTPYPNEDWKVVGWAVNDVLFKGQKPIIGPRWNWDIREILLGIVDGIPAAVSTQFTKYGHIVCVVGFTTDQDLTGITGWGDIDTAQVKGIIIDDPYGDRTSGSYTSEDGYNCLFPLKEFLSLWKSAGIQVRVKV